MGRKAPSGTVKTWNTFVAEEVASACHEYSEFYFNLRTMVLRMVPVRVQHTSFHRKTALFVKFSAATTPLAAGDKFKRKQRNILDTLFSIF